MSRLASGMETNIKNLYYGDRKFLEDEFQKWIQKHDADRQPKYCIVNFMAFLKHFCEGSLRVAAKEEEKVGGFRKGDEVIFIKGYCDGCAGVVDIIPRLPSSLYGIAITNIDGLVDKDIKIRIGVIVSSWIEEFKLKEK